jgi:hypothetical protein
MSESSKLDKIRKWNPKFLGVGVGVWCLLLFILWIIWLSFNASIKYYQSIAAGASHHNLNREPVPVPEPTEYPEDDTEIDITFPDWMGGGQVGEGAVVQSLPLENMVLSRSSASYEIEITNPTIKDFDYAFRTLVDLDFELAILKDEDDKSGQTYLQAIYDPHVDGTPSYTVEYRDGTKDKHYQDVTSVVSIRQLIKLFIAYGKRDTGWLDEMKFQRLHFDY